MQCSGSILGISRTFHYSREIQIDTSMHPLAGKPVPEAQFINVSRLVTSYFTEKPDPDDRSQRIAFGTSGHRGSSFRRNFNEAHILSIVQAVCDYRKEAGISGPLFVGMDTHALSEAAFRTAIEVLAANAVEVRFQLDFGYTPTPVISHAILGHNRHDSVSLADGLILTPSHNPPDDGGIKYNPPSGGPAGSRTTGSIEKRANELLASGVAGIKRIPFQRALKAGCVHGIDFMEPYVADLENVVNMEIIGASGLRLGADPMGGSGLAYWDVIADRYDLNLRVVNPHIDSSFSFMHVDWDGKIRMDCSSPWAMAGLIGLKDEFDVAFGNDPDFDRHGIVTRTHGLLNPNAYLAVAIDYLLDHRQDWTSTGAVGKTLVSSSMIDRVAGKRGRPLFEVPVGFKWFVEGLLDGSLVFGGEESAGASFLRRDGSVWTTDKDGIIMNLLAAEITAVSGKNPGEWYDSLTGVLGHPVYERIDAPATDEQKSLLRALDVSDIGSEQLAGEPILEKMTHAPGNGAPIGGLKIRTENGWFAARPSGTEAIYKIYSESFLGHGHLVRIQEEARALIDRVFSEGGI